MLKIKLPSFLKRKEVSPLDIELKKYKKKDRERLRALYEQYQNGNILKLNKRS
jgi:hypothetical protein